MQQVNLAGQDLQNTDWSKLEAGQVDFSKLQGGSGAPAALARRRRAGRPSIGGAAGGGAAMRHNSVA